MRKETMDFVVEEPRSKDLGNVLILFGSKICSFGEFEELKGRKDFTGRSKGTNLTFGGRDLVVFTASERRLLE